MEKDLIELKKLILDDEFIKLQNMVNQEINLMDILRVSHKELQHSNFLAWLFNPIETHNLKDYFLKEFIKLYYKENGYKDLGNKSGLSVFQFVEMNLDDILIKREYSQIDLILLSPQNKLCIIIENKIFSSERPGQLKKYRNKIEEEFSDYKHKIFIYLSLFNQEIDENEQEFYVQLTYKNIKKLLEQLLQEGNLKIGTSTKFVLEQYLQTLKTIMNDNKEIEDIAKMLYGKYKGAFDLVLKYASPNNSTSVPNNLEELIKKEDSLVLFNSNRNYIRFQPKFLFDSLPQLKEKGFISQDDELKDNWLFLFEFHITSNYIYLDHKIGLYHSSAIREKLYNYYLRHTDVFNKVQKANGELRPTWHQAFQKKILTPSEYEKLSDNDEELCLHIQKRFREFMENDLPRIKQIILQ